MACMWCGPLYDSFFILQVQNTGSALTLRVICAGVPEDWCVFLLCYHLKAFASLVCLYLVFSSCHKQSQGCCDSIHLYWMLPQDGGLSIPTDLHTFVVKDCGSSTQEEKISASEQGLALPLLLSRHLIEQNSGLYLVACIFPLSIRIFLSDLSHNPLLSFSIVQGLLPMST